MHRRHVAGLSLLLLGQLACARQGVAPARAQAPEQGRKLPPRTLHVIGDSTAAEFPATDARVGWAAVLASELTGLRVDDAARSGRSSKSFYDEGHFDAVKARLEPGDLLLIQFGHNDEKDDPARATDPATTFRDNLRRYVTSGRARGAAPVLLTPISRRRFDGDRVAPSHGAFPEATRAVAAETQTPLLDLTTQTARLLERFGLTASERLFAPEDNTHLSLEGARVVAHLVAAGLRELGFDVTSRAHAPSLTFHAAPASKTSSPAVLICPGGGYTHLSTEKEGSQVASWLNTLGISAFVLHYRLADWGHPAPLEDVRAALRLMRQNASAWRIDAERVGVLGFSAGGHLAACASCLFQSADERPDFAALIYPVITLKDPYAHAGSRRALLGANPDPVLVAALSLETRVSARTPPTFIMHTQDDASVPVENSLMYQAALTAAGVPNELHVYEHGPHGLGMSPDCTAGREWPQAYEAWLTSRGIIGSRQAL